MMERTITERTDTIGRTGTDPNLVDGGDFRDKKRPNNNLILIRTFVILSLQTQPSPNGGGRTNKAHRPHANKVPWDSR